MLIFTAVDFLLYARPAYFFQPIHLAARKGDLKKVRELLDKDPTLVNAQLKITERGKSITVENTPLFEAAQNNHLEIAKLLIERGAKINVGMKGYPSANPLLWAAGYGFVEMVRLLLDKGADINVINDRVAFSKIGITSKNATALHLAAAANQTDVVKLLVERGADRSIRDENGKTPLDIASERKYLEVANLLKGR